MENIKKILTAEQKSELLATLQNRFAKFASRHPSLNWADIQDRLLANPAKLWSLAEMERTGGEPDVVGMDAQTGEFIFFDCAAESPSGRRSLCYDQAALAARKENKPRDSAMGMAADMGIEMLTEEQFRELETLGEFNLKSTCWVKTPDAMRKKGGALFCDRRYDRVFAYYNGVESYYASRGFRGSLRV